jgi:hypothetical protein
MNAPLDLFAASISHGRAKSGLPPHKERVMSLSILILLALLGLVRAAFAVWRLWSQLPRRNADFGFVDADFEVRP